MSDQHDANAADGSALLPIGTRIRFIKLLAGTPDGAYPARTYATEGDFGTILGHEAEGRYRVKRDYWKASFGASHGTEFVVAES